MGSSKAVGAGGGALSGAATGATIGSVIPGVGTLIGAGVGALAGGVLGGIGAPDGEVPQYQQPPEDPQTLALKQRAEQDRIEAGMETARIDSASLLARYGTLVSMANAKAPGAPGNTPAQSGARAGNPLADALSQLTTRLVPQRVA